MLVTTGLILSLVVNVLTLISIVVLVLYAKGESTRAKEYHEQWSLWEHRYYTAQKLIAEKFNYHLAVDGLRSSMELIDNSGD